MTNDEIRATAADAISFLAGVVEQSQPDVPGDFAKVKTPLVSYELGVRAASVLERHLNLMLRVNAEDAYSDALSDADKEFHC